MTKLTSTSTPAIIVQSVLITAAIGANIVNGSFAIISGIIPETTAKYDTVVVTNGVITNGIIRIGFITIGAPKIIGSLILNKPGTNDNLPNSLGT